MGKKEGMVGETLDGESERKAGWGVRGGGWMGSPGVEPQMWSPGGGVGESGRPWMESRGGALDGWGVEGGALDGW